MVINEIRDPRGWNDFLLSRPTQTGFFLQSWDWGEFQAQLGRKVWRLGITRKDTNNNTKGHELAGMCMIVKHELPMGRSYLYAPRGPVVADESRIMNQESWNCFIDYVRKIVQKESAVFLRIEPANRRLQEVTGGYEKLQEVAPVQPKQTLILDLSKSKEELLAAMHEKTRYNIRLAYRKGVRVKTGQFEEFWKLMRETAKRDKFRTHPRKYYEIMLRVLSNPSQPSPGLRPPSPLGRGEGEGQSRGVMSVRLHMAYHGTTPVAAAIVGYFGDTATYLHGASSYEDRALMAPYALHWDIINDAKKDGYLFYDFWGIQTSSQSSVHSSQKSWEGITRFKMGFASETSPDRGVGSGYIINYPGTFDLPLRKFWYKVYRLGRKFF